MPKDYRDTLAYAALTKLLVRSDAGELSHEELIPLLRSAVTELATVPLSATDATEREALLTEVSTLENSIDRDVEELREARENDTYLGVLGSAQMTLQELREEAEHLRRYVAGEDDVEVRLVSEENYAAAGIADDLESDATEVTQ